VLQLRNISKSYNDNNVLKDISLSIEKGEIVSLLGPSGCGKTTLLNVILGLTEVTQGQILYNNREIQRKPMQKRNFNIVFQDFCLFPHLSAYENIVYGLKNIKKRIHDKRVTDLIELLALRPHLNKKVHELSGGQKQRVAIAGVLAVHPKIIILDESTSMLDPEGRQNILNIILKMKKRDNLTILSITHDIDEAQLADQVIILNDGIKVDQGTPNEIFNKIDQLKELGLDVPFAFKLKHKLSKAGISVPDYVNSEEKLVKFLCQLNSKM